MDHKRLSLAAERPPPAGRRAGGPVWTSASSRHRHGGVRRLVHRVRARPKSAIVAGLPRASGGRCGPSHAEQLGHSRRGVFRRGARPGDWDLGLGRVSDGRGGTRPRRCAHRRGRLAVDLLRQRPAGCRGDRARGSRRRDRFDGIEIQTPGSRGSSVGHLGPWRPDLGIDRRLGSDGLDRPRHCRCRVRARLALGVRVAGEPARRWGDDAARALRFEALRGSQPCDPFRLWDSGRPSRPSALCPDPGVGIFCDAGRRGAAAVRRDPCRPLTSHGQRRGALRTALAAHDRASVRGDGTSCDAARQRHRRLLDDGTAVDGRDCARDGVHCRAADRGRLELGRYTPYRRRLGAQQRRGQSSRHDRHGPPRRSPGRTWRRFDQRLSWGGSRRRGGVRDRRRLRLDPGPRRAAEP